MISIPTALLDAAQRDDDAIPYRERQRLRMIAKGYSMDFRSDAPLDPIFARDRPWDHPHELSREEITELTDIDQREVDAMGPWGRMPMDSRLRARRPR